MSRRSNPDSDWLKSIILFIHPIFSPVTSTFSWLRPYMFIAYKIQIFVLKFRFWMIVTPKPRFSPDFPQSFLVQPMVIPWEFIPGGGTLRLGFAAGVPSCGRRKGAVRAEPNCCGEPWPKRGEVWTTKNGENWGSWIFFWMIFWRMKQFFLGLRLTKNGVDTIVGGCIFEDESMLV